MQPEDMVGQILGHYRLLRPLGHGGSATVFLAEDITLQRQVAVKVFMPREGDRDDFLRRFAREARVLAQLDHPHILPVYEYGEDHENAYLVMPHMAGGSLYDRLRGRGAVPAPETVQLINQILNALQYAHERNLIHRDIKPGNMLFKADDTLMLSDFGLVKVLTGPSEDISLLSEATSLSAQMLAGTPSYMSPEQISGKVVPASDIYAIGVVLYEMLTGKRLFDVDTYMATLIKHMYEQPRSLREINPQISPLLESIVLRTLAKDPAQRYQHPHDLQQALQQAIAENPTTTTSDKDSTTMRLPIAGTVYSTPPPSPPANLSIPPIQQQMNSGYDHHDPTYLHTQQSMPITPSSTTHSDKHPAIPASSTRATHTNSPPGILSYPTPTTPSLAHQTRSNKALIGILLLLVLVLAGSLGGVLYIQDKTPPVTPQTTPDAHTMTPDTTNITPINKGASTPLPGSVTITMQVPPTSTDCPATNQARAQVTAPLQLGNRQNIVYIVNEGTPSDPTFGTIKRREANPNTQGIEISKMAHTSISEAQISQDGRWVLFVANVSGQSQLRMVRVDGQGLQTLYCAPPNLTINHTQMSFNQQYAVFNISSDTSLPTTYLINIISGALQPELVAQAGITYIPQTWLDNIHVYMTASVPNSDPPQQNIYILDLQKGQNQHDKDLLKVLANALSCGSFDSSYDSSLLLLSTCQLAPSTSTGKVVPTGPSTITSQPASGGNALQVATFQDAVTTLRAISTTTLLVLIENQTGTNSNNGLWAINTDGSGLIRLTHDTQNVQSLCQFSQYAWSNVSRGGNLYAVQEVNSNTDTYNLYYGSLSGGTPIQFAGITGTQLLLAGWTSM